MNINNLKPIKILGKGSQGTVILTNNENYVVKIYTKKSKRLKMLIHILHFFINYNKLPKTIYKSYYITEKNNSLKRYISNNNLPLYFSYKNENDLIKLSEKYNFTSKLFEIMKKYDITLNKFIDNLFMNKVININHKIKILHSLFYQGLFTLVWLYMKKGIIHSDINSDNFLIEKTNDKEFKININKFCYKVKLYGYYLVMSDFGYSRSIELVDYDNYQYNIRINMETLNMHPLNDIIDYIKFFKKYFKIFFIKNIGINIDEINSRFNNTKMSYRNMIRSYYKRKNNLKENIKIFKNDFFIFFRKYILNEKINS
jgi:hypothetical protein